MKKIAVFASGAGSNAKKIIEYFHQQKPQHVEIALIACNKPEAGVLQIAASNCIDTIIIEKERFFRGDAFVAELQSRNIEFIVLAGFLWKIPARLIEAFSNKIVNIHPALLPKYGGKGMYGSFVHEAVVANKEKESGITIHWVNENYDEGKHIFQARCVVEENDSPNMVASKIHALEHEHFAKVIEGLL